MNLRLSLFAPTAWIVLRGLTLLPHSVECPRECVGSLLRQEYLTRMAVPSHPWASVIIPIKDERDNLVPLLESLLTVMSSHAASQTRPFEIIFVDDGSSDGSSEGLDRLATQHSQVRVFHLDRNYGKTCAIEAGFSQSSGDLIIELDGDLQQDSKDILKLLPDTETYDVVCGWRQERQDGLMKKMSSRIANRVRNFFIHDGVHDTGCPLKIFRRPVLERRPPL